MPQRVRVHVIEADALPRRADRIEHGAPREGLTALRDEQPRQTILAGGKVAADGAQLVAGASPVIWPTYVGAFGVTVPAA